MCGGFFNKGKLYEKDWRQMQSCSWKQIAFLLTEQKMYKWEAPCVLLKQVMKEDLITYFQKELILSEAALICAAEVICILCKTAVSLHEADKHLGSEKLFEQYLKSVSEWGSLNLVKPSTTNMPATNLASL